MEFDSIRKGIAKTGKFQKALEWDAIEQCGRAITAFKETSSNYEKGDYRRIPDSLNKIMHIFINLGELNDKVLKFSIAQEQKLVYAIQSTPGSGQQLGESLRLELAVVSWSKNLGNVISSLINDVKELERNEQTQGIRGLPMSVELFRRKSEIMEHHITNLKEHFTELFRHISNAEKERRNRL